MKIHYILKIVILTMILIINNYLIRKINYSILNRNLSFFFDRYVIYIIYFFYLSHDSILGFFFFNKQILSSRTVQWQAGVVFFGHGICLHFDPPCTLQDVTVIKSQICIFVKEIRFLGTFVCSTCWINQYFID